MLIVAAVIAPVSLASPIAVAHIPTVIAAAATETLVMKMVLEVKLTMILVVLDLVLLVALVPVFGALLLVGATRVVSASKKVESVIAVTRPDPNRLVAVPEGIVDRGMLPLGRPSLGAPLGRAPEMPYAPAHDPFVLGRIVTVAAFRCPVLDFALVLVTVTQSPTAKWVDGTVTVWVNRVEEVHETVTWPVSGFWTCIEPVGLEIAATVPDAVENAARLGAVVVVGAAVATDPKVTAPATKQAIIEAFANGDASTDFKRKATR